jgi:hypothetical protein
MERISQQSVASHDEAASPTNTNVNVDHSTDSDRSGTAMKIYLPSV